MKITNNGVSWLCERLQYFLGVDLSLRFFEGHWELRHPEWPLDIHFPQTFIRFDNGTSDLPYTKWQPSRAEFRSPLNLPLPAPGISKLACDLIIQSEKSANIGYDIPGMVFWCLTRREELGRTDLDSHQRFSASKSHAEQFNYLTRPIVDEWMHVLRNMLRSLGCEVFTPKEQTPLTVSHDVDRPSRYGFSGWLLDLKRARYDFQNSQNRYFGVRSLLKRRDARQKLPIGDPFNTFDWLMNMSEQRGIQSTFYFICGGDDPNRDAEYDLLDPSIQELLNSISDRDHRFGLHPSYHCYHDGSLLDSQAVRIKRELQSRSHAGGLTSRMHYLRWDTKVTPRLLANAGVQEDNTLSYADRAGFRCGTCHGYPAFDVERDTTLPITLQPLIAMEESVLSSDYMDSQELDVAFDTFTLLKSRCMKVGGTFSLLWHNSSLNSEELKHLYTSVLDH